MKKTTDLLPYCLIFSKVSERILYNQIDSFMEKNWKKQLGISEKIGVIFMDLLKG